MKTIERRWCTKLGRGGGGLGQICPVSSRPDVLTRTGTREASRKGSTPAADAVVVCLSAGFAEAGGAVAGHGHGAYFSNELDLLGLLHSTYYTGISGLSSPKGPSIKYVRTKGEGVYKLVNVADKQ